MELIQLKEKVPKFFEKYKFVFIVLLIGVILLVIPDGDDETTLPAQLSEHTDAIPCIEEQLSNILSMIQGAGKVQVMLTVACGEEYLYQTNSSVSTSANGSEHKNDTVTVSDSQRNDSGLIRQVNPPIYLGAVIVCQGADNPAVKLAVTDAVSRLTGLGSDKISVLKMK